MLRHYFKDSKWQPFQGSEAADQYKCLHLLYQLLCHPQMSGSVLRAKKAAPAATLTFAFHPLGKKKRRAKAHSLPSKA